MPPIDKSLDDIDDINNMTTTCNNAENKLTRNNPENHNMERNSLDINNNEDNYSKDVSNDENNDLVDQEQSEDNYDAEYLYM